MSELKIALAIRPDSKSFALLDPLRNINADLLDLCSGFMEIVPAQDQENGKRDAATVRVIHQSAKDYLLDYHGNPDDSYAEFRVTSAIGHIEIARSCLTYLLFEDVLRGPLEATDEDGVPSGNSTTSEASTSTLHRLLEKKLANTDFLEYATLYWPFHVR